MQTLKKLIRLNPLLFSVWYHLYRKHRGVPIKFFSTSTKLYLDGYPRSGNTYSLHLITTLWPDLSFVHHFHAIAPIKIALKKKIPVFILVRDPMNAIASWYLKKLTFKGLDFNSKNIDVSILKGLASDYHVYYQWVLEHRARLELIPFEELVRNQNSVLKRINHSLPRNFRLTEEQILDGLDTAGKTGFGAKDKLGSSLPTKEKEEAKKLIKEKLASLKKYKRCLRVFNEL